MLEQKVTTRRSRNHKGRGVGEPEDWIGVLESSAKSIEAKRSALLLENRRPPVPSGGRADAQKAIDPTNFDRRPDHGFAPSLCGPILFI